MYQIGIDIGSTASKVAIFKNNELFDLFVMPTGWSSVDTSNIIKNKILEKNINLDEAKIIATGYGRVSVPYADKTMTEITCHAVGANYIFNKDGTVIDVGGQDTKIIRIEGAKVLDFKMNDKCAAGTGRFIEVMANILGLGIEDMAKSALVGKDVTISSVCTVFAESEVISLIGKGAKREDIARGILNSITNKINSMLDNSTRTGEYFLTGGLCGVSPFVELLSKRVEGTIWTDEKGRFAGAIGAAMLAKKL